MNVRVAVILVAVTSACLALPPKAARAEDGPRLRLDNVEPGSALARVGFRTGDEVVILGGKALRGTDALERLHRAVESTHPYSVTVLREGQAIHCLSPAPQSFEPLSPGSTPGALGCLPRDATGKAAEYWARLVPAFRDGRPVGVELFAVTPDSLYAKLGIQSGDVIKRVNGADASSIDVMMRMATGQPCVAQTLEVERDGVTRTVPVPCEGKTP